MTEQQQQLFEELTAAIRRQPDCASLARYGGRIKALIAANQGTREEITPEMYGLLRSAYAVRKREIEGCDPSVGCDPGEPSELCEYLSPSESQTKIAIAVGCLNQSRNAQSLASNYVQCQMQFGADLPPEIEAAYEQRKLELEASEAAKRKLNEFGLNLDAAPAAQALGAGAASTAGAGNDFPYCE